MNIVGKSELQLEVLVSTINKSSLDFLNNMFSKCDELDFKILIVNQVSEDIKLSSTKDNIRIINSNEKGISKSRNLALKHAEGDICLFTDDDVIFKNNFQNTIINTFKQNMLAGIIVFKASDFNDNDYRFYPRSSKELNLKTIKGVMSIEMAFRRAIISNKNILFNKRFGLGSEFETGEEYLFCRDAIGNDISIFFENKTIVSHDGYNSGKNLGEDRIVYARAALNYSIHKSLTYFWIIKYVRFLFNNGYIVKNQIMSKIKVALKGIKDYKIND